VSISGLWGCERGFVVKGAFAVIRLGIRLVFFISCFLLSDP
jgi:hypothetical protein